MHHFKHTLPTAIIGSDELYNAVRAVFIANGSSLNSWCKTNGFNRQTVEKALKGERQSALATSIRQQLIEKLFEEVNHA